MTRRRSVRFAILASLVAAPAAAGPFDAAYRASIAGVTIGTARVVGRVGETSYRVQMDGSMSLLGFTNRFEASATGATREARLVPQSYALATDGFRKRNVAVTFADGRAVQVALDPKPDAAERAARIALEPEHQIGVTDPLSALLTQVVRTARAGDPCDGLARVFSGQARFDVELQPSRVGAEEIVCRATVRLIAGHLRSGGPGGPPQPMEVAFPKGATDGVRLPTRIEMPFRAGTLVIQRVAAPI